jgi:hypothetical protein
VTLGTNCTECTPNTWDKWPVPNVLHILSVYLNCRVSSLECYTWHSGVLSVFFLLSVFDTGSYTQSGSVGMEPPPFLHLGHRHSTPPRFHYHRCRTTCAWCTGVRACIGSTPRACIGSTPPTASSNLLNVVEERLRDAVPTKNHRCVEQPSEQTTFHGSNSVVDGGFHRAWCRRL